MLETSRAGMKNIVQKYLDLKYLASVRIPMYTYNVIYH